MQPFKLIIKNYRCFEDENPLQIEIGPGLTALVGPNNSGKSSLLKFFYELKPLWNDLCNTANLHILVLGREHGVEIKGIEDPDEIMSNSNTRPLMLQLEFSATTTNRISRVELTNTRARPNEWRGTLWSGSTRITQMAQVPNRTDLVTINGTDYHVEIVHLFDAVELLANTLYIGPFRNAITEGTGSYYDLAIGTGFIDMWDNLKTGSQKSNNRAIQAVTNDIKRIFGFESLEINAANARKTLQVIVNNNSYRLRELGAGLTQFVVALGNVAITRPSLLLIDEPELNLHPTLQMDFLTSLASYTKHGIIYATHSIGLARSTAERIYSFKRDNNRVIVQPFEQTPNFAEFVGEMSFSSFKELGHDTILLVEGVNEVAAVQQFLRLIGIDHQVVILPLGGSQFITKGRERELNELTRISNKIAVLIDSERTFEDQSIASERVAFLEDCKKLGFITHATKYRAFENYLTETAIQSVKGEKYRALAPYQDLKSASPSWAKLENWRIARAMTKADLLKTDVGQFLEKLINPTEI